MSYTATMDIEKNVSSENSNAHMMTVEIPVINPSAIQVETTTITETQTPPPTPAIITEEMDSKMKSSSMTPLAPMDTVDSQQQQKTDSQQQQQMQSSSTTTTTMTSNKGKDSRGDQKLANGIGF